VSGPFVLARRPLSCELSLPQQQQQQRQQQQQQQQNVHTKTLYDDDSGITRDGISKQTLWLWQHTMIRMIFHSTVRSLLDHASSGLTALSRDQGATTTTVKCGSPVLATPWTSIVRMILFHNNNNNKNFMQTLHDDDSGITRDIITKRSFQSSLSLSFPSIVRQLI
jgi:hypothetical protein